MNSHWEQTTARSLTAQTISSFDSPLVQYAIVWYITLSASSDRMLTISTICGFTPQVIISLLAGVWIDRYDRKKLVIISDVVIAPITSAPAAAFLSGCWEMRLLSIALFARSAGIGIQTPAVNAVIPQIVPLWYLMRMNGIQSTLTPPMMFLSPTASGAILSAAGLKATLLINVVTALIGAGITFTLAIPMHRKNTVEGNTQVSNLKEGFRYLHSNIFIYRLLMFQIATLFPTSPFASLTSLTVSRTFDSQVWRLIAPEMTYSIGTVLGRLLVTSWGGSKKRLNTTLMVGTAYGILMLGLETISAFWAYLALNTMTGIIVPCYQSPVAVSIQKRVEPSMQGRVFNFVQVSTSCALPLGMVAFGPLADAVRIQYPPIGGDLTVMAYTAGMVLKGGLSSI